MCLDRKGTFKPCKVGYKVMEMKGGKLLSEFNLGHTHKELRTGVWLNEEDFRMSCRTQPLRTAVSDSEYPLGWHTFHSYEDAVSWGLDGGRLIVVKVSVKEPECVGYQSNAYWRASPRITVSKFIKITKVC